jgi:hypothetical protein
VGAKWVVARFLSGRILIGIIILFGVLTLYQSVDHALGSRSTNSLAAENGILRRQLSLISPRVSKLETQASRLDERADNLQMLLHPHKIVGKPPEVSRMRRASMSSNFSIPAGTSFRP